jgi:hypothetical protein
MAAPHPNAKHPAMWPEVLVPSLQVVQLRGTCSAWDQQLCLQVCRARHPEARDLPLSSSVAAPQLIASRTFWLYPPILQTLGTAAAACARLGAHCSPWYGAMHHQH